MKEIQEIWRSLNISTLLILPLFQELIKCTTKGKDPIIYPIITIALEYGLINTFYNHDKKVLHLVFYQDLVNSDLHLTDSVYYSFSERLIDLSVFIGCELVGDLVIYDLKVPEIWYTDLDLVVQGKYSQTGSEFKSAMEIKAGNVPKSSHSKANYITQNNISYAIVIKGKELWDEINDLLGTEITINQEIFTVYDPEREDLEKGLLKLKPIKI
jgi:hypothetical protein